jgi:hypothetical protein
MPHLTTVECDGLHTPYLYGGTPGTVCTWHVEDCHLYSANYCITRADKIRYMIPPYYINNFVTKQTGLPLPIVIFLLILTTDSELLCVEDSEDIPLSCHQFLRHQFCINLEQSLPLQQDQ